MNRKVTSLEEAREVVRDGLITVPEAVSMLAISKRRLMEMLATSEIRSLKIGRRRLIPKVELELYLASLLMRRAG